MERIHDGRQARSARYASLRTKHLRFAADDLRPPIPSERGKTNVPPSHIADQVQCGVP
jgi:hypothetical protein